MDQYLKWAHLASGTNFDTLPDLAAVSINITHWHSHKKIWQIMKGTILVPISGIVTQIIQMLLWNHPYIDIQSFLQGITAHKMTRGVWIPAPLGSNIRALETLTHQSNIHLLLPHCEAGHLDLTPIS